MRKWKLLCSSLKMIWNQVNSLCVSMWKISMHKIKRWITGTLFCVNYHTHSEKQSTLVLGTKNWKLHPIKKIIKLHPWASVLPKPVVKRNWPQVWKQSWAVIWHTVKPVYVLKPQFWFVHPFVGLFICLSVLLQVNVFASSILEYQTIHAKGKQYNLDYEVKGTILIIYSSEIWSIFLRNCKTLLSVLMSALYQVMGFQICDS